MAYPKLQRSSLRLHVVYQLLEPLPVSVQWKSGRQTLLPTISERPPFCDLNLVWGDKTFGIGAGRFASLDHAQHTLRWGYELTPPNPVATFFERLVSDGRASVLHGPHCPLRVMTLPAKPPHLCLDAHYTWAELHKYHNSLPPPIQIGGPEWATWAIVNLPMRDA